MTLYLLDANVLIRAHIDYYPLDRIPQFWNWLLAKADAGILKIPAEIYDEVCNSSDLLGQWLQRPDVKTAIIFTEKVDAGTIQRVMALGYAPDLTDVEILKVGRDPFLVAAAAFAPDRVVVTREVSRPSASVRTAKFRTYAQTWGSGRLPTSSCGGNSPFASRSSVEALASGERVTRKALKRKLVEPSGIEPLTS